MKTTIDAAGRLVIPRDIRRLARLEPGMMLDIVWRDGRIEIEPAQLPVQLVQEGRLLVATPERDVAPLTNDEVGAALDALRREREGLD